MGMGRYYVLLLKAIVKSCQAYQNAMFWSSMSGFLCYIRVVLDWQKSWTPGLLPVLELSILCIPIHLESSGCQLTKLSISSFLTIKSTQTFFKRVAHETHDLQWSVCLGGSLLCATFLGGTVHKSLGHWLGGLLLILAPLWISSPYLSLHVCQVSREIQFEAGWYQMSFVFIIWFIDQGDKENEFKVDWHQLNPLHIIWLICLKVDWFESYSFLLWMYWVVLKEDKF